jgi:hypothetical protein
VLIVAEEDARDTIQFARYADWIVGEGGRAILECPAALVRLMAGCLGVERAIAENSSPPDYDFHISMLSLPTTLGTTLKTVFAARPYLGVEAEAAKLWKARCGEIPGFRIALALQEDGGRKSRESAAMAAGFVRRLGALPGVVLIDVQEGDYVQEGDRGREGDHVREVDHVWEGDHVREVDRLGSDADRMAASRGGVRRLDGWPDDPGDRLVAIAAALRGMDLLVCADNSVAHIAGAMGVRTCLVLAVSPDSRWLLNREDSPWYPTMRLFRQRYRGDWDDVATRLALELEREFLTDGQRERNQRGNAEGGEIPGAAERGRAEM